MAHLKDSEYTKRRKTDTIVIHCSETHAGQNFKAEDIRGWHIKERLWKDIGYNAVICRDGTLELGRPLWAVPAAVFGDNHHIIAVCMVGGCDKKKREENNFTPEQWGTLKAFIAGCIAHYPTIKYVKGHREYQEAINQGKYCPSFDVPTWWASVKDEVLAAAKAAMT